MNAFIVLCYCFFAIFARKKFILVSSQFYIRAKVDTYEILMVLAN